MTCKMRTLTLRKQSQKLANIALVALSPSGDVWLQIWHMHYQQGKEAFTVFDLITGYSYITPSSVIQKGVSQTEISAPEQ